MEDELTDTDTDTVRYAMGDAMERLRGMMGVEAHLEWPDHIDAELYTTSSGKTWELPWGVIVPCSIWDGSIYPGNDNGFRDTSAYASGFVVDINGWCHWYEYDFTDNGNPSNGTQLQRIADAITAFSTACDKFGQSADWDCGTL